MFKEYKVKKKVNKAKQKQILKFYSKLNYEDKEKLTNEILNTDLELMNRLYTNSFHDDVIDINNVTPLKYISILDLSEEEKEELTLLGLNSITNNEYAIVTMAGGSGTRLGHPGPKGTYMLDLKEGKMSIFEVLIKQLKDFNLKYNVTISWYLMTGIDNYEDTVKFFNNNNYFDYDKDKIHFFIQDELPVLDTKGKILLKEKNKILTSSNGNGDVFNALKKANITNKLKKDGVKWILFTGIDNILVKFVDPLFLGLLIKNNYLVGSKTLFKEKALDKDYIFCKYNDKPFMLPYNNITEEFSNLKEDDRYLYRDINIAIHLINILELEKYSRVDMKYHRCFKKSNYIDSSGNYIEVDENNSFKFEKYIFDIFSYSDDMLLYRVERNKEFAPIKNKEGNNSPKTAIKLYEENHM